jgi:hypothetical protein
MEIIIYTHAVYLLYSKKDESSHPCPHEYNLRSRHTFNVKGRSGVHMKNEYLYKHESDDFFPLKHKMDLPPAQYLLSLIHL